MTVFYNEPKDGAKFASLGGIDWDNINSMVEFSELKFVSDDDYHYLYFYCHKFTDLIKVGDKDWKFQPQPLTLKIARKSVSEYDFKAKKKVDRAQSKTEQMVCIALADLDTELAYKGFISLTSGSVLTSIVDCKDGQGKEIPEVVVQQLRSSFWSFEEIEALEHLDLSEVKIPEKKSYGSYSKGQTELDKLNDRIAFIKAQLKLAEYPLEITHVGELANLDGKFRDTVDWCLALIAR